MAELRTAGGARGQAKERESQFELMRIAAMLMIVASHLTVHGVQHVLDSDIAYQAWNLGSTANKLAASLFPPGGGVGVALFFMLTGYFLVGRERTSVLRVCLAAAFYGVFLTLVLAAATGIHAATGRGYGFVEMGIAQKAMAVLRYIFAPASIGAGWFVQAYVLLVLPAPLINRLIASLNRGGVTFLLAAAWFFWYSCQYVLRGGYLPLGRAFFFYLLGAYHRLYTGRQGARARYALAAAACWLALAALSFRSAKAPDPHTATAAQAAAAAFRTAASSCVLTPACAWCIFTLFSRLRIGYSRAINTVAATTFGVYLLHDSSVGRALIWNGILRVSEAQFPSPRFPLLAAADVLGVFAACSALDYLRLRLAEPPALRAAGRLLARWQERFAAGGYAPRHDGAAASRSFPKTHRS